MSKRDEYLAAARRVCERPSHFWSPMPVELKTKLSISWWAEGTPAQLVIALCFLAAMAERR